MKIWILLCCLIFSISTAFGAATYIDPATPGGDEYVKTTNGKVHRSQIVYTIDATGAVTPVAGSSSSAPLPAEGRVFVQSARNAYASVNVTTGAYVQLIASTSAAVNAIEVFDSSGQDLILGTGGAGVETAGPRIVPGGNGPVSYKIAAGTRLSIKAVSATASAGILIINLYQ